MCIRRQPEHIADAVGARRLSQGQDLEPLRLSGSFENGDERPEVARFVVADGERDDVAAEAEILAGDHAGAVVARRACGFDHVVARGPRVAGCCGVGTCAEPGARARGEGSHSGVDDGGEA